MKKLIVLLSLISFAIPAFAQETPAAPIVETPAWSYSMTPSVVSNYMFRGQLLDGFSAQPEIEADRGNFSLGIFSNIPFENKIQPGPETDLYGSYSFNINDSKNFIENCIF